MNRFSFSFGIYGFDMQYFVALATYIHLKGLTSQ